MNIRQRSRGLIRTSHSQSNHSAESKSRISSPTMKVSSNHSENGFDGSGKEKNNHHQHDEHELTQLNPLPVSTTFSKSSSSAALARDRKAAKNLFIFVFVFSICWCPYTFLTLIRALCKNPNKCISALIYEVTFWLLWLNSTINPLLYSFLHVKFRKAFYRILCFYRVRHRHRLRSNCAWCRKWTDEQCLSIDLHWKWQMHAKESRTKMAHALWMRRCDCFDENVPLNKRSVAQKLCSRTMSREFLVLGHLHLRRWRTVSNDRISKRDEGWRTRSIPCSRNWLIEKEWNVRLLAIVWEHCVQSVRCRCNR